MQKLKSVMFLLAALVCAAPVMAQQKRMSPHETISKTIDRNRVTITYGRPYAKGRKIWGELVPFGKIWRTGADEATTLITEKTITIGGTEVPAGAYTLFTLPAEDGTAKLVINKQLGQWGLSYNEKNDLARVDLTKAAVAAPVEQFTMAIEGNPSGGGLIKMSWESTEYSVAFALKK
jgi:hypothetical protein